MKKRRLSVRALCCALALLMLSATLAACGSPSKPKIEENKGELAATYPFVVHTKSATWYLAADDIALPKLFLCQVAVLPHISDPLIIVHNKLPSVLFIM